MIEPGAVLGVLGGGQLGRMFALAARRAGYRVAVYTGSPNEIDTPAGQAADRETAAPWEDLDALARFAAGCAAVTYEWENVPLAAAEAVLAAGVALRPGVAALAACQDRRREKAFVASVGAPTAAYAVLETPGDLAGLAGALGERPAVLKTATSGYDGKGQVRLAGAADAPGAWAQVGHAPSIVEELVEFDHEASVLVARSAAGAAAVYPAIRNTHARHILDTSVTAGGPAGEGPAAEIAVALAEGLDLVGVLAVELFVLADGGLVVNELAPRPHNSGHLTIEAAASSQFDQQLRALCDAPLGDPATRPAAMANLLGELWGGPGGAPRWGNALAAPGVALHLYGKAQARPGRKMGHLTAVADTPGAALDLVGRARRALEHP